MRYWKTDGGQGERVLDLFPELTEGRHVVSVTGAGGKTSLIWRLTAELVQRGRRVIVTTTTHMAREEGRVWAEALAENGRLSSGALGQIAGLLEKKQYVFTGRSQGEKIACPLPSDGECRWVEQLSSLADVVLVEADGSRRHPVKVPAPWEPVIPPCTTLVAAVAGLSCLGYPAARCCHRPELWRQGPGTIQAKDLAALARDACGMRKGVKPGMEYRVIFNQADKEQEMEAGLAAARLLDKEGIGAAAVRLRDRLGAVLLAAGKSSRFGENKLLYPVEQTPMAGRALHLLSRLLVWKRVVVTGYEEVASLAEAYGISSVFNPHPEQGISRSLQLGMRALSGADGWLFLVADQPWLKAESVNRLIDRWQEDPRHLAALCSGDQIGNPVIFSAAYAPELLSLAGDKGGKKIFLNHPEDAVLVETEARQLEDMDVKVGKNRENTEKNLL